MKNFCKFWSNYFLSQVPHLSLIDIKDNTPLHFATYRNLYYYEEERHVMLKTLLGRESDINLRNFIGKMPFHLVLEYGYFIDIKLFLDNVLVDINSPDGDGNTPLHYAIIRNNKEADTFFIVKSLIDQGVHIDAINKNNKTPLHFAIEFQNEPVVQLLLKEGADPNIPDIQGNTALHLASYRNPRRSSNCLNHFMLKSLLEHKAKVDVVNKVPITPFDNILQFGNEQDYQLFIEHGSKLYLKGFKGIITMDRLIKNFSFKLLHHISREYIDEIKNKLHRKNSILLHTAVQFSAVYNVQFLVENGMDINSTDYYGNTPLHWLLNEPENIRRRLNMYETIKYFDMLINLGADVNAKIKNGDMVLKFVNPQNSSEVEMVFIQSLAKYILLRQIEATEIRNKINGSYLSLYFQTCLRELESLKAFVFYEYVSLVPILMNDTNIMTRYCRDQKLLDEFFKIDFEGKFRVYGSFIRQQMSLHIESLTFHKSSVKEIGLIDQFGECLPREIRLYEIIEKILSYFDNYDLIVFSKSHEYYGINPITAKVDHKDT